MRIKLDENLPVRLLSQLRGIGHDVDAVPAEMLSGATDAAVWEAAQRDERFLITQDLDFSDVRKFVPGSHFGILIVRLNAPGRNALLNRVRELFEKEAVESWHRCFVVVTDTKVRVRRLETKPR